MTVNLLVSEEMKAFIEERTAQGGFASASEYLCSLIREAQRRRAKQALEDKLLEGLQGPAREMTAEDWAELRRKAMEGLEGETLRP